MFLESAKSRKRHMCSAFVCCAIMRASQGSLSSVPAAGHYPRQPASTKATNFPV